MITKAQRAAVEALDLPFELSDSDIARQFNEDGTAKIANDRDPMDRVRDLANKAAATQTIKKAA